MDSFLKEARFVLSLTQYQLAKMAGVPQSKISLIESGIYDPSPEEQQRLAEALGYSIEELFPSMAKETSSQNACSRRHNYA